GISRQRWRAGANASIAGMPPWPCDRFRLTDFNAARCERPARRQKVTCTAQDTTQRSALSRLDARGFEDRAPLGDLCTDERIELRGTIADQLEPLRAEPRLHGRVLRDPRYFRVQPCDHRGRRTRRGRDAVPAVRLVAGESALRNGWNLGRKRG